MKTTSRANFDHGTLGFVDDGGNSMPERVRERFHASRFIGLLGLALPEVASGRVHTRLQVRPDLHQSDGLVHPGVLAAMAEHSAIAAAETRSTGEQRFRTIEIDLRLAPPSAGDTLECTAEVESQDDGRILVRIEVFSLVDPHRHSLASGTITVKILETE